jgi:hypothetical protein
MSEAAAAIGRSVLYASLFDYPLTLAQLRQTLIESEQTPSQILATFNHSAALRTLIEHRDGFFFPRGCVGLVRERRRREGRSRDFLRQHQRLLQLVAAMPYVRLAALSGSIAHQNLDGRGDLDLFIVTRGDRVWSVTVAVVLVAKLLGLRKSVCANFVIADSRLTLDQQDLFTASQIIHLKPIVGEDLFRQFVAANPFVARYYPNFHPADCSGLRVHQPPFAACLKRTIETVFAGPSRLVEAICCSAYGAHLRRRASTWQSPEQVRLEDDYLKLHTHSHRAEVMRRFDDALGALDGDKPQPRASALR